MTIEATFQDTENPRHRMFVAVFNEGDVFVVVEDDDGAGAVIISPEDRKKLIEKLQEIDG